MLYGKGVVMKLDMLFRGLAEVFDAPTHIEQTARTVLLGAADTATYEGASVPLRQPLLDVMRQTDAHPVCNLIMEAQFDWAPPQTSQDPLYVAHSHPKAHVELLGPDGIIPSEKVRLGIYGILPNAEYGVRTHRAEEVFIMLAGEALWKRGDKPYAMHGPGERSHHPSMLPHATKTGASAFMSVYTWVGDLSTESYEYKGMPTD